MKYSFENIVFDNCNDKPRVLVISGVHGDETNAVINSMYLKRYLKNNKDEFNDYLGEISFLIGINESGIKNGSRKIVGQDKILDINRMFGPEEINIEKTIKEYIEQYPIVIDIHNSRNIVNTLLISNDGKSKAIFDLACKYQIPFVIYDGSGITIKDYTNNIISDDPPRTKRRKFGFTVELNSMGLNKYFYGEIAKAKNFLVSFLKTIKELSTSDLSNELINQSFQSKNVVCNQRGMIDMKLQLGDFVNSGEIICNIVDYNFNVKEIITAPIAGRIMQIAPSFYTVDDSICLIQPFPQMNKEVK